MLSQSIHSRAQPPNTWGAPLLLSPGEGAGAQGTRGHRGSLPGSLTRCGWNETGFAGTASGFPRVDPELVVRWQRGQARRIRERLSATPARGGRTPTPPPHPRPSPSVRPPLGGDTRRALTGDPSPGEAERAAARSSPASRRAPPPDICGGRRGAAVGRRPRPRGALGRGLGRRRCPGLERPQGPCDAARNRAGTGLRDPGDVQGRARRGAAGGRGPPPAGVPRGAPYLERRRGSRGGGVAGRRGSRGGGGSGRPVGSVGSGRAGALTAWRGRRTTGRQRGGGAPSTCPRPGAAAALYADRRGARAASPSPAQRPPRAPPPRAPAPARPRPALPEAGGSDRSAGAAARWS